MNPTIRSFHDVNTGTWSYLVWCETTRECAIIDPVLDFDLASATISYTSANLLFRKIQQLGLKCRWILETHAHADHLTAADYLKQQLNGKTVIGRGIQQVQKHFAKVFNLNIATDGSQFDCLVAEGDKLLLGQYKIEVFETPGHTSDSVIYKVGNNIFLGDTFFHPQSGTARCDFPGGDAKQLFYSLSKILSFDDATQLWLCHDYPGNARKATDSFSVKQMKNNIHWQASENNSEKYQQLRASRDAQLPAPKLLLPALQINICAGKLSKAEDNGTNYLKIPLKFSH